jgi:hypothetical protein
MFWTGQSSDIEQETEILKMDDLNVVLIGYN